MKHLKSDQTVARYLVLSQGFRIHHDLLFFALSTRLQISKDGRIAKLLG